jgi:hypothetical protein
MNTLQKYFDFAQLAQAAYADVNIIGSFDSALVDGRYGRFSTIQAAQFLDSYAVIDASANPNDPFGFSATVFKNVHTNEITLAIRGTEPFASDGSGLVDLTGPDADIVTEGYAQDQIYSLYNYVQRLITPANKQVAQWERTVVSMPGRPNVGADGNDYRRRIVSDTDGSLNRKRQRH